MNIVKVKIENLKNAEYNPRKDLQPEDPEYQKIEKSLVEFGYVEPIIVNSDYTIISGHQRVKVLKDKGRKVIEAVKVDLEKDKEKALNIAMNKISGEWDNEKLASLLTELKDLDQDNFLLTGFDDQEFENIMKEFDESFGSGSGGDDSSLTDNEISKYTDKIEKPSYSPQLDKAPDIKELYDTSKADELIKKIKSINCDKDLKKFLLYTANRFVRFNYENIAEYYCHQNKEIQEVFEMLALVIIDFKSAIENGFVEMTKNIVEKMPEVSEVITDEV